MDKPAETRRIWDVPLATLIAWDGEKVLYLGLTLVALIARVYGLGWRAMSHDESLHALYSWQLYDGRGYEHNPMMHGPFLFHINTLFYFLFGVNDATARLSVALLGTLMIPLCWGLRRWIGRVGALATAVMITISPSLLYYSRYIRNDVYIAFWLLVMLIAVFRYLEEQRARWLYVTAAALAVSYATKEVAFLHTVILAGFLILVILARLLREPWERPAYRALCLGLLAAGGAAVGRSSSSQGGRPSSSPSSSWASPSWRVGCTRCGAAGASSACAPCPRPISCSGSSPCPCRSSAPSSSSCWAGIRRTTAALPSRVRGRSWPSWRSSRRPWAGVGCASAG